MQPKTFAQSHLRVRSLGLNPSTSLQFSQSQPSQSQPSQSLWRRPMVAFGLANLLSLGLLCVGSGLAVSVQAVELKDAHAIESEAGPEAEPETASSEIPLGLVVQPSPYSVTETGDRFESLLTERGVTVFDRIDHEAGAASVDLSLRPTQVIIFGNPAVGTPLMQCGQSVAIDLPQKALIWEDAAGQVYLGYNDPAYLAQRHGLSGCDQAIAQVSSILAGLADAVLSAD